LFRGLIAAALRRAEGRHPHLFELSEDDQRAAEADGVSNGALDVSVA
jgi:hypothetical protein